MSYAAIEVELRNGHLVARGSETLPVSAEGLLVITSDRKQNLSSAHDESWQLALACIRNRQAVRGHTPRNVEDVFEQVRLERESWD